MNLTLLDRTKAVFPLHPKPTEILLDETNSSEFSDELRDRFQGKPWDDLSIDDWVNIGTIDTIRCYILPKAFHYYLPSILVLSLMHENYIDWGLKAIVPGNQSREPKGKWWGDYFACFTEDQKKYLQEYILMILERIPENSEEEFLAQIALEKIWL